MNKFIALYKGPATDMSEMSKEKVDGIMAAWQKWMEDLGDKLADIGAPFGEGASLVDDGSDGTPLELSGYSIINAKDLNEAKELCRSHPFLSEGKGNFSVEVFELTEVPSSLT